MVEVNTDFLRAQMLVHGAGLAEAFGKMGSDAARIHILAGFLINLDAQGISPEQFADIITDFGDGSPHLLMQRFIAHLEKNMLPKDEAGRPRPPIGE